MSIEDTLHGMSPGFSSMKEDATLSCCDLEGSLLSEKVSMAASGLQTHPPECDIKSVSFKDSAYTGHNPLLKALMEAESAANAAAIQLMTFKDAMEDECASAADKWQMRRQKGLLLEKLQDFKRVNKSVRQKLKLFRETEFHRIDTNQQMDMLMTRISQIENENENLRKALNESKKAEEELNDLRREQQEEIKTLAHMTKTVEATRAHLQGQLRNKEAENNRLTVQLRNLERTLVERKVEFEALKGSISAVTDKASQDQESLKKACQAQKRRAERFEAAVEKCYVQLKEKDVHLANVLSESDSLRQLKEKVTEERDKLAGHAELLKCQIAELTLTLQKEKDNTCTTNESVMQQIERLRMENRELGINNAALTASVADLEQQITDSEAVLVEEKLVSQERKHQAEQLRSQFVEQQAEMGELRMKYASLVTETERLRNKNESDAEKGRRELQGRVEKLKVYPQLLSAAEQSLLDCRENLRHLERNCSEKSESIRVLQVKMECQSKLLRSSAEMKGSIEEANLRLHERITALQKKLENVQDENSKLIRRLAAQEEALNHSTRQLEQRPAECQALSRQLEAALSDVREQLNRVKNQAASREEALKTKIMALEIDKSRRESELKHLHQSKVNAEKQFKARLKDLQLSLEQSESRKQSIQNYVDFLKNSYKTMFDDGLHTSNLGSSYFFK